MCLKHGEGLNNSEPQTTRSCARAILVLRYYFEASWGASFSAKEQL